MSNSTSARAHSTIAASRKRMGGLSACSTLSNSVCQELPTPGMEVSRCMGGRAQFLFRQSGAHWQRQALGDRAELVTALCRGLFMTHWVRPEQRHDVDLGTRFRLLATVAEKEPQCHRGLCGPVDRRGIACLPTPCSNSPAQSGSCEWPDQVARDLARGGTRLEKGLSHPDASADHAADTGAFCASALSGRCRCSMPSLLLPSHVCRCCFPPYARAHFFTRL